jgi:hypothetical protein
MAVDLDKLILAEDSAAVPRMPPQDPIELPGRQRCAPIHLGKDRFDRRRVTFELGLGQAAVWLTRPVSCVG